MHDDQSVTESAHCYVRRKVLQTTGLKQLANSKLSTAGLERKSFGLRQIAYKVYKRAVQHLASSSASLGSKLSSLCAASQPHTVQTVWQLNHAHWSGRMHTMNASFQFSNFEALVVLVQESWPTFRSVAFSRPNFVWIVAQNEGRVLLESSASSWSLLVSRPSKRQSDSSNWKTVLSSDFTEGPSGWLWLDELLGSIRLVKLIWSTEAVRVKHSPSTLDVRHWQSATVRLLMFISFVCFGISLDLNGFARPSCI